MVVKDILIKYYRDSANRILYKFVMWESSTNEEILPMSNCSIDKDI